MRYISELEHKVQTLQTEATTLSAQLTMLQVPSWWIYSFYFLEVIFTSFSSSDTFASPTQRDSAGLANQNNELKFRLQAMEQQAHLRDGNFFHLLRELISVGISPNSCTNFIQKISLARILRTDGVAFTVRPMNAM